VSAVTGLEEFDRPPLPLMPKAEHERIVAPIFGDLQTRVLGAESGRDALTRFSAAVDTELAQTDAPNLMAITYGTVISPFVAISEERQHRCTSSLVGWLHPGTTRREGLGRFVGRRDRADP